MEPDKKCWFCRRTYRGAGHEDVCTKACWVKKEYAIKHPKKEVAEVKACSKPKTALKSYHEKALKKANDRWLARDKATVEARKEAAAKKNRKRINSLMKAVQPGWSGRQYRSVRG